MLLLCSSQPGPPLYVIHSLHAFMVTFIPPCAWIRQGALVSLLSQFKAWLCQFQRFWLTMELVDSSLWVLEPLQPTRAATSRRIVLGECTHCIKENGSIFPGCINFLCLFIDNSLSLSMYLEVDWRRPGNPPQCSFLGPDRGMRYAFNAKLIMHAWL